MPPLKPFTRSCVALAVSQVMLIPTSSAATINVISNADDNPSNGCTLRQAVVSINSASLQAGCAIASGMLGVDDTINLNLTPANNTITLTKEAGGQLQITEDKSVTIRGAAGTNISIDGGGESRVFYVRDSRLSLDYLTITGGSSSDYGGGIRALSSNINLSNCNVSENTAYVLGGGISVASSSTISLNNSTVSGNSAAYGGGIRALSSSINLNNSTVSNNSGSRVGAISAETSVVNLSNSTISGNSSSDVGGIAVTTSTISLSNTLIAGNQPLEITVSNDVSIVSNGTNLFGDNSRTNVVAFNNFTPETNDITATSDGIQPTALLSILSPLADNGGPTLTHALPDSSPAIGTANTSLCPESDQRGVSRDDSAFFVVKAVNQKVVAFELGDDECDIGSFER